MDARIFERLLKSIFFKDDVYKISDEVFVVSLHDRSMGGHGVFTMESTVEGLFEYWAKPHSDKDFSQFIADEEYEWLIELVDSERDQVYAEREAMKLARCISDVSNDFGLPASHLEGVTDETLAQYRADKGIYTG